MTLRRYASTLLAAALLLCTLTGCGAPARDKLVKIAGYGTQLAAQIAANQNLPEALFEQGVITQARRDYLNDHIAKAKALVARFNDGMAAVLAEATPDVRSLVQLTADMVSEVQALSQDASPGWKKALSIIEESLQAIATYFASHVSELRRQGVTDSQLARYVDLKALRTVEAYAGR